MASGKTIALLGGSFNPPHDGHFQFGKAIYDALHPDEVWMMFSLNPHKDPAKYETFEHRIELAEIIRADYPEVPFVLSDIEEKIGSHKTFHVLEGLKALRPDDRFIWTMGVDSLIKFHTWGHAEEIFTNFSIAVIDRDPFTQEGLNSPIVRQFSHKRAGSPQEMMESEKPCWVLLDKLNLSSEFQSHVLLERIKAGETDFPGAFNQVARRIREKGYYGVNLPPRPAFRPQGPQPSP